MRIGLVSRNRYVTLTFAHEFPMLMLQRYTPERVALLSMGGKEPPAHIFSVGWLGVTCCLPWVITWACLSGGKLVQTILTHSGAILSWLLHILRWGGEGLALCLCAFGLICIAVGILGHIERRSQAKKSAAKVVQQ